MTIKVLGIDHIHINVRRLQRFREIMQQLFGPDITPVGHLEPFGFYNSCVSFPESSARPFLDVFQPANDEGFVGRYIREHGQGVSFISFQVENLDQAAEHAARCGLKEISREGYRGMKQVQFDTFEELGFYLEFVEYEPGFHVELEEIKRQLRAGATVDGLTYVDL
jgi:hypothetical protein